jgi:hypothetical protein
VPRVKSFAEKEADRARTAERKAKIAALPAEVAEAVRAMPPTEADQYLASLDKVADMQASGATFTPDLTKSDQPKKKPGRKPAANPGQRTAAPMTRDGIGESLEEFSARLPDLLEDCPEDDPDVPVQFGYDVYEGQLNEHGNPIVRSDDAPKPTAAEREAAERAAERAEQEEYVAAALARLGLSSSNVVAGPFAAVQLVTVGDPDVDLANYRIDRRDCELRLIDTGRGYRLEMRYLPPPEAGSDGPFEEIGTTYHPDGSVASLARVQIKPIDFDAFGLALSRLASPHPAVASMLDRGPRGASEGVPKTDAERRQRNEEIKRQMIEQRQRNALHRGSYEGDVVPEERTWLTDMI